MWRVSRCCGPGGIHSRMMSHGSGGSGGGQQTEMLARAAQLFPGGSNGNTIYQDTVISYGRGARVYDVDGREYIDYVMGGGPMMLGHAHPSVTAAVAERMPCGTSFFGLTQAIIEHATELSRHFPCAEQVRYCSSGTEATLFALRAARALSGKPMVLKFEGAYHGMNDYGLMSLLPEEPLRPFPQPSPSSVSISKQLEAEVLIAPFNDLETTAQIIEAHREQLGAVICEPVQRVLEPRPGFLRGLREICTELDIPLVFDEIATGFRVCRGGAQERYGVVPDLCTLGKVPAGGFPMAMIAGKRRFMDAFNGLGQSALPQVGTFNGHPIAATAGLVHMKTLDAAGFDDVNAVGEKLKQGMSRIMTRAGLQNQVIGPPTLFDFFLIDRPVHDYRDEFQSDRATKLKIVERLKVHGVFKAGIKFYPSLAHTLEDVTMTLKAFELAVGDVLEGRELDN